MPVNSIAAPVKPQNYYSLPRWDMLQLYPVHRNIRDVLEIGCGTGETGAILKAQYGVHSVVGIEINESCGNIARTKLDKVIIGNIEDSDLPVQPDSFDLIILGDVLEHLVDPWGAMQKLHKLLRKQGMVLISIPNVQHWRNLLNLVLGRWEYTSHGLLDITHLRFFTKGTISTLLKQSNYTITEIRGKSGKIIDLINRLSLGIFSNFLSFRYFILAERKES